MRKAATGRFDRRASMIEAIGAPPAPGVKLAESPAAYRPGDGLQPIPLERLAPDPHQPRKSFPRESIAELAESLRAQGQLIPATVFWDDVDEVYQIVDGERRYRAAEMAGRATLDCLVLPGRPDALTIRLSQIAANDQREDVPALERAASYARAIKDGGLTQAEFCRRTGLKPARVSKALALLDLDPVVRGMVGRGYIDPSVAYELRSLDAIGQVEVADLAHAEGWAGAAVKAEVDRRSGKERAPLPGQAPIPGFLPPPPAAKGGKVSGGNAPADPPAPAPHPVDAHIDRVNRRAADGSLAPAQAEAPGRAMWEAGPILGWALSSAYHCTAGFEPDSDACLSVDLAQPIAEAGWGEVANFLRKAADAAGLIGLLARVPDGGARPGDRVSLYDPDSPSHGAEGVIADEVHVSPAIVIDWKGEKGRGQLRYWSWPERLRVVRRAGKGGGR